MANKPHQFGHLPAPTNWYEAAQRLKGVPKPPKPQETKKPSLYDRIGSIEEILKRGGTSSHGG